LHPPIVMKASAKSGIDPFVHAAKEPEFVKLPAARFLAIEGVGAPEAAPFQEAIAALYGVAYTLKFSVRKAGGEDFRVGPLEALWWAGGAGDALDFERTPRSAWRWKAMIRLPGGVTKAAVEAAKRAVIAKRGALGRLDAQVTVERFAEGRAVQLLHVGPYATEPASIARMRAAMDDAKLVARGRHHEIYLGDPRRTRPDKLRTILRQPVA
jgi:hypothetical protein